MLLWTAAAHAIGEGGTFIPHTTSLIERLTSFVGLFGFCGLSWLISENRSAIRWRPVAWAIGLQLVFGLVVLSPWLQGLFIALNDGVGKLLSFSNDGATFAFRSIEPHFVDVPTETGGVESRSFVGVVSPPMKSFATWILPTIIFFSTLMSILYHLNVMQVVVRGIAGVMMKTIGTSGAETLSAAGNIFLGQTEAPLLIKPFLATMTRSELMAVMVGGFATVAGGVMGAYVGFLKDAIPDIAGHLIVASILSAPAALATAKIMVPETQTPRTLGSINVEFPKTASNVVEAGANGASEGMKLAINVAAMLIGAVALMSMLNWMVGLIPVGWCEGAFTTGYSCGVDTVRTPLSLEIVLGWVFAPLAVLMGVPWSDGVVIGGLLGEKLILTEFVAYLHLGQLITGDVAVMTERGAVIASYGLCGFANFASIGIQLGGIGAMLPAGEEGDGQRGVLAAIAMRAMVGGAIACCMTGCVVGLLGA